MTFTDYLMDISLIALVLVQMRTRRLSLHSLILPIGIVAFAATQYLHAIPTAGNDLVLISICAAAGTALGMATGLATFVWAGADGRAYSKAGAAAAILWLLGVGSRFAFQLYVSNGGQTAIAHFSAQHAISSATAWSTALILMAFGEVIARTVVLAVRRQTVGAPRPSLAKA